MKAFAQDGLSMSDLRVLENYLFDSTVQVTASSSDPSFPVSNLTKFQRSDVWRSYGNFVITDDNKYVNFKSTGGGSELTVAIDTGSYTPSQLATHLGSIMTNMIGTDDTITVSYSYSTGLFTVATDGTYLDLLFSTGTNASDSCRDVLGFGAFDKTGATTYTGNSISLHTEEWVLIDLGTYTHAPVDSAVVFFEYGTGSTLSQSAVVKLQASQTNLWDSPSVDVTMTYDQTYETYSHFFSSSQTYRYWRIKVVDESNANLYVELPKIVLSKSVAFTQVPSSGFKHSMVDMSKLETTAYGHVYTDNYSMLRMLEFSFSAFSKDDLELLWKLYRRTGKTTPIAVVLDSQATLYDKDRFLLYCQITNDFSGGHVFYSYFDTALSVREVM